jgi:hypothetical protein
MTNLQKKKKVLKARAFLAQPQNCHQNQEINTGKLLTSIPQALP